MQGNLKWGRRAVILAETILLSFGIAAPKYANVPERILSFRAKQMLFNTGKTTCDCFWLKTTRR